MTDSSGVVWCGARFLLLPGSADRLLECLGFLSETPALPSLWVKAVFPGAVPFAFVTFWSSGFKFHRGL